MSQYGPWKRGMICITAAVLLVPLLDGCTPVDTSYKDPWHEKIAAAGIVEKNVEIGQVSMNYA
jgi:hypothetical protein